MLLSWVRKSSSRSQAQYVAFAMILTALSLTGCGPQKAPVSVDQSNMNGSAGASSQMEIQIRNPLQLKRTALNDATGNPERYAVHGELVEPGQAVSRMLAGQTVCYSKIVNYEPYVGDQMSAIYSRTTRSEDGKTVQYLNVNRVNETQTASIGFVCMKLYNEVQPQEMRAAFGELLKVVFY